MAEKSECSIIDRLHELIPVIVKSSDLSVKVKAALSRDLTPLEPGKGVVLIAMGKGAPAMARGAIEVLGEKIVGGMVATAPGIDVSGIEGLEVILGGHPIPNEGSLRAGEAALEWARQARGAGGLLVLVSGGGSALVEAPLGGLSLEDITRATKTLLESGASIDEINAVRKHVSRVKGGRLAAEAHPAPLLGLYASDVPGDRLDAIASGPTTPDPTTYKDALGVLEFYGIRGLMPSKVVDILERGARGELPETPKPGDRVFANVRNELVAANIDVLQAIAGHLEAQGYKTLILTSRLEGESKDVARALASIALEALGRGIPERPPLAVIAGGETTVKVRGKGRGGRNTELALAWAIRMSYWGARCEAGLLAMDTDGIDGVTDAAGAVVAPEDARRARAMGLDPLSFLADNDSYTILSKLGRLIKTGPTGSNLNSVIVMLVGGPTS
ncbi:MAG: glycerate kinase [Desulfurococcales archaeon]|nr:glycerate kinase [Desulfurococcales archaeon]